MQSWNAESEEIGTYNVEIPGVLLLATVNVPIVT